MQDNNTIPMQRLDAYIVAKEIAKRVHEAKIRDTELRDQATRAAKSNCSLCLQSYCKTTTPRSAPVPCVPASPRGRSEPRRGARGAARLSSTRRLRL
jgi:hypothetical protein